MGILRLAVLGGFEVELVGGTPPTGEPVRTFESDKARALLAYLAVESGRPHRRESLAGLFWPEKPESRARHSLSQALSSLKESLSIGPGNLLIEITPQEVLIRQEDLWLDAREFTGLIQACDLHKHPAEWACRLCLERLEQAAALYKGDFLAGFHLEGLTAFEEWLVVQQEVYRRKMVQVTARLSQGYEFLGDLEKALIYAQRQNLLDPLNETAHRQVMGLLAKLGRRTEALAHFMECQKILLRELGVEPEAATVNLYQQIHALPDREILLPRKHHNLPAPLTRTVGREAELEQLCLKLVDPDCRLITVLGPGGTGKSRLALEAGRSMLPAFLDGVFLAELDTQPSHQTLAPVIARSVGLELRMESSGFGRSGQHNPGEVPEQLSAYLEDKNLLLILDGFEGRLQEAGLVNRLLRRASGLKILATSRARLNLEAEQIYLLEGLAFPPETHSSDLPEYDAVRLFSDAARRVHPWFELTEHNLASVAEICRLVQGLPLGILLAAAWVGMLDESQIVEEIHRSLDFLASDWHDLPDRQHSLRATFDYSWRLLGEAEREVFLRLAIFHGSFTAERARQVAGASLRTLKNLIDQSLLMHAGGESYRMHDLLRQYAQEKLGTSVEASLSAYEKYCHTYLAALVAWKTPLKGHAQPEVLAEIDQEYADILAAWEWAVEQRLLEPLEKAFEAMSYYHNLRGLFMEGDAICQRSMQLLERDGITAQNLRLWVRLGTWRARACIYRREYDLGRQILDRIEGKMQEWEELAAGMRWEQAILYQVEGSQILNSGGNRLQALEYYQRSLDLMMTVEDPWEISFALYLNAVGHGQVGNIRETGQFANEALAIQTRQGDPNLLAGIFSHIGYYDMLSGYYEAGIQAVREQNDNRLRINDRQSQAVIHEEMGLALFYAGEYEQARSLLEKAVPLCVLPQQEDVRNFSQYILTGIDLNTGNYAAVLNDAVYAGELISDYDRTGLDLFKAQVHLLDTEAGIYTDYNLADREANHYLEGVRSLPRLDMVGQPLALLGYIAYRRKEMKEALRFLRDALANGIEQGFFIVFCMSLAVLALMIGEGGDIEQAVELYAAATAHPWAANSCWFDDLFGKRMAALAENLSEETREAACRRGRERELYATGQEYLEKLKAGKLF